MPKKLLLEDCHEFVPKRNSDGSIAFITESAGNRQVYRLPGRLSVIGEVNGNKRRYPEATWDANLQEGSTLQTLISKNAAFGLLEHPSDGQVNLNSPISHLTTKVIREGKEIHGEITILNTPEGNKLKALIEGGWNPTVSSRGFGTLLMMEDGVEDVQADFVCEGWDVVMKPSFGNATLNVPEGLRESAPAAAPAAAGTPPVKPITESTPPKQTPAAPATPKLMKKNITESLAPLQTINPATLLAGSPKQFGESLQRLSDLHGDVAKWAAEDPTRSWEATQLHESISREEARFAAAAQAPIQEAQALKKQNGQLVQVLESVTKTAIAARKLVKESNANVGKQKKVTEEIAKRGKAWQERAGKITESKKALEERLAKLEKNYKLACESLDLLAAKYNTDVTALGKRVIELEFPTQVTESATAETLKKASHPKHIVALRESITGKPAGTAAPVQEGIDPAKAAADKAAADKAAADKAAADAKALQESQNGSVTILRTTRGLPGSVSESINTVKNMRTPAVQG